MKEGKVRPSLSEADRVQVPPVGSRQGLSLAKNKTGNPKLGADLLDYRNASLSSKSVDGEKIGVSQSKANVHKTATKNLCPALHQ